MSAPTTQPELHRTHRIGWLRAAVPGANDGNVKSLIERGERAS